MPIVLIISTLNIALDCECCKPFQIGDDHGINEKGEYLQGDSELAESTGVGLGISKEVESSINSPLPSFPGIPRLLGIQSLLGTEPPSNLPPLNPVVTPTKAVGTVASSSLPTKGSKMNNSNE